MPYTGQAMKRFEDHRLLAGQSAYTDDLKLPGMLHAMVLRSPHAHARIRSLDSSAASRLPGVVSVFTADDFAGVIEHLPTRLNTDADEMRPTPHPVLAKGKVGYVGQAVAIVVAEDAQLAKDGMEQIVVDYEPLPVLVDPMAALLPGSPVLHEEQGGNVALRTLNAGGDLDEAFKQADLVVTQRYHVQRLAPAPA